jgi:uroporphyrinogen-III synthase
VAGADLTAPGSLQGRVIGITADRRADDQSVMFTRMGATVVQGPTMSTRKVPDPDRLRSISSGLIAEPPEFLVADTGIGVRTWVSCLEEWGIADRMRSALAATRIASRGPKASGALTSVGLTTWWRCPSEQLSDLVEHLLAEGVEGRRVAIQLHGDDGCDTRERLEAAGAEVIPVPVYVWGPPEDPSAAARLVEEACAGGLDAITFTAGPQVGGLMAIAGERAEELRDAAGRMVVGCIGPVCAEAAVGAGLGRPVVPASWRLGALVKAVAAALGG